MTRDHEKDDHMIFERVRDATSSTGHSPMITVPSQVLRIPDKEELEAQLHHYGASPFIMHVVQPNNVHARKFYVEKVRPALRYYCQKFGIDVPPWLQNDNYFHDLSDDEKVKLFGTTTLARREFRPLKTKKPNRIPA